MEGESSLPVPEASARPDTVPGLDALEVGLSAEVSGLWELDERDEATKPHSVQLNTVEARPARHPSNQPLLSAISLLLDVQVDLQGVVLLL